MLPSSALPRSAPGSHDGAATRIARTLVTLVALMLLAAGGAAAQSDVDAPGNRAAWSVGDLWTSPIPYALGHRGYGADDFDADPPHANTLDAFHTAFANGIRVIELDLQQTADGRIVVFHDDTLQDGRCVNGMTYDELLAVEPEVPLFHAVLVSARHFGFAGCLNGIIFAEIKVPIPHCNDDTTSAMAAATEGPLVAAVIEDIVKAGLEDQVIINSGSPSILRQAMLQAPDIERALTLNVLQMLPPSEIPARTGYPVHKIPKNDCGLDWYDVSDIARLPTFYPSAAGQPDPLPRFIMTALGCNAARAVSIDKLVLLSNPAAAPVIVGALKSAGLEVVVWTVDDTTQWKSIAAAGADGITTNHIAMGLERQSAASCPVVTRGRGAGRGLVAGRAELALGPLGDRGARSVPIAFALPDAGAARIALVDVAGRRIDAREVGSFGAGRHVVTLGRDLKPGVYFVRLSHERGEVRAKAVVVQ